MSMNFPSPAIDGDIFTAPDGRQYIYQSPVWRPHSLPAAKWRPNDCRLDWGTGTDAGKLVLSRHNGRYVTVNDAVYELPSGGVALAASGLAAGTLYYIYLVATGSVLSLEASATSYAVAVATGQPTKSGDLTRAFVGLALGLTATTWDVNLSCAVQSWYNPRPKSQTVGPGSFVTSQPALSALTGMNFNYCNIAGRRLLATLFAQQLTHTALTTGMASYLNVFTEANSGIFANNLINTYWQQNQGALTTLEQQASLANATEGHRNLRIMAATSQANFVMTGIGMRLDTFG